MAVTAEIQALYIAYFNRPADPSGLNFWIKAANAAGGTAAVANAFSASGEYKEMYAGKSYVEIVDSLYVNLFGRHAEADGLIFWSTELQEGRLNVGNIAVAIQGGAQNADKIAVESKVAAATAFTTNVASNGASIVGYVGAAANQVARDWLSTVTDPTSLATAITETALDAVAADVIVAHDSTTNVGTSFSTTAATDTLVGTAMNDTFNVGSVGSPAGPSLNALDSIDGGAGIDTLNIENTGGLNPLTGAIKNVEILNFKGAGAVNNDVAITAPAGSTAINLVSTDDVLVAVNGLTKQVIGLNAVADVTVVNATYADAQASASVAATNLVGDATVNLTGAGLKSVAVAINGTAAGKALTVAGSTVASATVAASADSTVALTGALLKTVTVSGKGAVDLAGTSAELSTLTATAAVGGVTYNNTGSTTAFTANTGAGDDTLTLVGAQIAAVNTGVGDDNVIVATSAAAATATIDLGAGNDTINISAGLTKGVTLIGGEGTDNIASTYAGYNTFVAAFDTAASLAKITGFESISITDVLANSDALVLGKIAGVTSAQLAGVATGGSATVSGVGAAGTIVLKGDLATNNGALVVNLADATGKADALNLVANTNYTQNSDATVNTAAATVSVTATGVETVNFNSTGTPSIDVPTGAKVDAVTNTLALTDIDLVTVNISGNQKAVYAAAAGSELLTTVNGSTNTAGVTVDGALSKLALTITGSATEVNTLSGSANADTIVGGAKADTIFGGVGADKLTGGAGNDTFAYTVATQSTLAAADTISDFTANTFGNGTSGAAGTGAGVDATKWTGDVLSFDVDVAITKVAVGVYTNSSDASIFIQNTSAASTDTFAAALDSSTGKLYLDWNSDGTVDSVINLTGVTTLTAAAFHLV